MQNWKKYEKECRQSCVTKFDGTKQIPKEVQSAAKPPAERSEANKVYIYLYM